MRTMVGAYPLDVMQSGGAARVDRALQYVRNPVNPVLYGQRERTKHQLTDILDVGHRLAKVRVASSNLVIRSKKAAEQRPDGAAVLVLQAGPERLRAPGRAAALKVASRPPPRLSSSTGKRCASRSSVSRIVLCPVRSMRALGCRP